MIRKSLPFLLVLALAGCLQPSDPAPVLDQNGVEVLPTDEAISEDELLS